MPNPLNLSDSADLIDVAIQDIFLKGSEAESRRFADYYNEETGISDYYVKDSSLSGLGYAGRIVENAAVTAASPVQGLSFTSSPCKIRRYAGNPQEAKSVRISTNGQSAGKLL